MTCETDKSSDPCNRKVYGDENLLHRIALVWLIMSLLCIPIWWRTTSVEREPINYDNIEELDKMIADFVVEPKPSLMTLSETYDILLSLVLPNIYADWNIEDSIQSIEEWTSTYSAIANFTISSQIIYQPVEHNRPSRQADTESWSFSKAKLSNVINSIETHFQSNVNPSSKLVQLVVYVPDRKFSPLYIDNTYKRSILPDWGSFMIMDQNDENLKNQIIDVGGILNSFVKDLDLLFGTNDIVKSRIVSNLKTTSNTINSLSTLLQRVHNMVINKEVAGKVDLAVEKAMKSITQINTGNYMVALKLSRESVFNSESAFFDPSLLELLYFPQDQKFAIYIPMFLPLGIPILQGGLYAIRYFKSFH